MQELMRMNFTQTVEQLGEHIAHEVFGYHRAVFLDEFL